MVDASRTVAAISPELLALINAANESGAILTRHSDEVLFPLTDRFAAARKHIPHFTSNLDETGYWSTANAGAVDFARRSIAKDPERRLPDSAALRQLVAASHRRRRAAKALAVSTGYAAAERENDRLGTLSIKAQDAVRAFACLTVADLHAKVTFLIENEMVERDMGEILPDLDRIIAEGTSSHG